MHVKSISKLMPNALKVLPVAATMALSTIAINANAQNKEIEKVESDSITAVAKGTIAANNNDSITFENPINDSIAKKMNQKSEPVLSLESNIGKNTKLGFNIEGTGSEVVLNRVLADLSLASVGTPYAGAYKALVAEKEALSAKGEDTSDVETQIDALEDAMRDYIRDNQALVLEKIQKDGSRTEFHYGENKSKTGYITQTIGLKGNGGIKDRDTKVEEAKNDSTQSVSKNKFDGGATYGLTIETANSEVRFNGDFDSDNIDLSLSAETKKKTKNGTVSAAMSVRETVDTEYHEGSGGVSLDYTSDNKDLTTGAYAYYDYEKEKGFDALWEIDAAAYLKYKNNVRLEVGNEHALDVNYVYSRLNLTGKKVIPQNSISLNGRLEAEYGGYIFPASTNIKPIHNVEVKARGNMIFNPESDILATLGAGVNYGCNIDKNILEKEEIYTHDVAANILGSFKKGKVGLSALISLLYSSNPLNINEKTPTEPLKVSSNVTMELQDLFKGITPFVSYTLNTGIEGLEHNIGGGLRLGLDKLSEKKK